MASLTQYAQKKLLDHTLGGDAFSIPTTHLALFRASPGETGSLVSEVSGGDYARVALSGKLTATVLATGLMASSAAISFPTPTADWGTVTHLAVCDASSAGNVLLHIPLTQAIVQNSGGVAIEFIAGAFEISALATDISDMTRYLAKKWLDHVLGIAAFTQPSDVYLGLFSDDPTASGTLTSEVATGAYARQIITDVIGATDLATGIATLEDDIAFPDPTAAYTVTHYGIMDALTSGNMLFRRARSSTLSVASGGAPVRIQAGRLALQAA